ncbi:hypothetical protein ACWDZX_28465, partial [Streptomyces collinus]
MRTAACRSPGDRWSTVFSYLHAASGAARAPTAGTDRARRPDWRDHGGEGGRNPMEPVRKGLHTESALLEQYDHQRYVTGIL